MTRSLPPNISPSVEHFPPNISLSNSIFKISSSHPIYPHAWNISKVSFPHQLYLRAWNIQGRLKFFRKFLQFGSMTRPLPPNVSPSIDHFKKVHHVKQCFPFQQLKTKVYLRTFNENKCIDFNLFAISLGQWTLLWTFKEQAKTQTNQLALTDVGPNVHLSFMPSFVSGHSAGADAEWSGPGGGHF